MTVRNQPVDTTRASRDGHEFHEIWAARRSLQLLLPQDDLIGIAIEGLQGVDESRTLAETVEIADLTLYYGKYPSIDAADRVTISQFKYSVSSADDEFHHSFIKKTVHKFAKSYRHYRKELGVKTANEKFEFELVTNRPASENLLAAIDCAASGTEPSDAKVKRQLRQLEDTAKLKGKALRDFAKRLKISGLAGDLTRQKYSLSKVVTNWTVNHDAQARAVLGELRQLVRDKAGTKGQAVKVVVRVDILKVLGLQDEDDLFRCPPNFPKVGEIVQRTQLAEILQKIDEVDKPLLIHASGGVGKTVLMRSIASSMECDSEVVLFDCFAGGNYRAEFDARHLPASAFAHIANSLACKGLCDPLIPHGNDLGLLIKGFLNRLQQAIDAIRRANPEASLVLMLDAIDNSAIQAKDRNEESFAKVLLSTLDRKGMIAGLKLVASCRTERRERAIGQTEVDEIEVLPFSIEETSAYIKRRLTNASQTDIDVAFARSGGNPRVLEHLVLDRGLLDPSDKAKRVELDDLLMEQISGALKVVRDQGYEEGTLNIFLGGLAVLRPPIPVEEYAQIHGFSEELVKSFAADLAPLLEQTHTGLTFRDEEVERFIRTNYADNAEAIERIAESLLENQEKSLYAAQAAPLLLQLLGDGDKLFALAFDKRTPSSITGVAGKRAIRHARLKAAAAFAAKSKNYNYLVRLLVELASVESAHSRGNDYLLNNPDLVIGLGDADAARRLFEIRASWPGTRHCRISIANTLSGAVADAYRHARKGNDWINDYVDSDDRAYRDAGPESQDIAAIPLCLLAQGKAKEAARWLARWFDWYAYETALPLWSFLEQAASPSCDVAIDIESFTGALSGHVGLLTAALRSPLHTPEKKSKLVRQLKQACRAKESIRTENRFSYEREGRLQDGLLEAAGCALLLGQKASCKAILAHVPDARPGVSPLTETMFPRPQARPYLVYAALWAAANSRDITLVDLLPRELRAMWGRSRNVKDEDKFIRKLKSKIQEDSKAKKGKIGTEQERRSESSREAELSKFLDYYIKIYSKAVHAFEEAMTAPRSELGPKFDGLINVWTEISDSKGEYGMAHRSNEAFDLTGRELIEYLIDLRIQDLHVKTIRKYVQLLMRNAYVPPAALIDLVRMFSVHRHTSTLAGEVAVFTSMMINRDDEVTARSQSYAMLARAIMPASIDDARAYFAKGLEQLDAIGSNDYEFANDLLLFAASLHGDELDSSVVHALTNVCELNMSDEAEKFPWEAFGGAMSRVAGCRGFAKISRWDDREKISLNHTLPSYLTYLVEEKKIEVANAIALYSLANPAERWSGTSGHTDSSRFAEAIVGATGDKAEEHLKHFLAQYQALYPGLPIPSATEKILKAVDGIIDSNDPVITELAFRAAIKQSENDERNRRNAGSSYLNRNARRQRQREQDRTEEKLNQLLRTTHVTDEDSLSLAIEELNGLTLFLEGKQEFFVKLRSKLSIADVVPYVRAIASFDHIGIYTKLDELEKTREQWSEASAALASTFGELSIPLIDSHIDDIIGDGRLSGYHIAEIAKLTDTPKLHLATHLACAITSAEYEVAAPTWIALAGFIAEGADPGEGQSALSGLLKSEATKLAEGVQDGEYSKEAYLDATEEEIIGALVWRRLGAPLAADRWRAAHCVRHLADYGQWSVIDQIVARVEDRGGGAFQAPELPFYHLHAKLWLLIAIARIAKDHAHDVARYQGKIETIVSANPAHVLIRHFAADSLLVCNEAGAIALSAEATSALVDINTSHLAAIDSRLRTADNKAFHWDRPDEVPEPDPSFSFEYDFGKEELDYLGRVFGKAKWETGDEIVAAIRYFDETIESMHEAGGRSSLRRQYRGIDSRKHLYGQYLVWHGQFMAAASMVAKYPVTQDSYYDDPWPTWLNRELLTRSDGYWLADGRDRKPRDAIVRVLKRKRTGTQITGERDELLSLLNIRSEKLKKQVVLQGDWRSSDGVKIRIASALVAPHESTKLARTLAKEKPMMAWVPHMSIENGSGEFTHNDKDGFDPFIVEPRIEPRLDGLDPFGSRSVAERLKLSEEISDELGLSVKDRYGCTWLNASDREVLWSEAWGHIGEYSDENSESGTRLLIDIRLLKSLLRKKDRNLLTLIELERYKKSSYDDSGGYTHTTMVVTVDRDLKYRVHRGFVNHEHVSAW